MPKPANEQHVAPPPNRSTRADTAVYANGKLWRVGELAVAQPASIFAWPDGRVGVVHAGDGKRAALRIYALDGSHHDRSLPFPPTSPPQQALSHPDGFWKLDVSATSVSRFVPRTDDAYRIASHLAAKHGPLRGIATSSQPNTVLGYRQQQLLELDGASETPFGPVLAAPIERVEREGTQTWVLTVEGELVELSSAGGVQSTRALEGRGIALSVNGARVAVVTARRAAGKLDHSVHLLDSGVVRTIAEHVEGIPADRTLVLGHDQLWFGTTPYRID